MKRLQKKNNIIKILGIIIFFSLSLFIFYLYSIDYSSLLVIILIIFYFKFFKKVEIPSYLNLALLASVAIFISFFITKFLYFEVYAIPAIAFSILVTALFDNISLSLSFSFFIAALGASIAGGDLGIGLGLFSAALVAAKFSYRAYRRFDLIKAGFFASIVQFFVIFLIKENSKLSFSWQDIRILSICLLNGFFSSISVIGLLPIFEFVFNVVTNISLLELSDFNRPLLKRLILEAPGTYQHSIIVANLSEMAADAIGANPLLVRVGAYYHDIGKLTKPNYFMENVVGYKDVHKNLKPSLSKLIIINHVKDGIELANKYRLSSKIVDFIAQHHGRSLVYFFYQKAKSLEPDIDCKEEYRYPGPKPQTKEVVIVSLADTVEALSRTLEDPTSLRIEEMVREVIKKRFIEGELDESNLVLKDLEKIAQAFICALNAFFHTRINYPRDDDRNSKSTENKENKT